MSEKDEVTRIIKKLNEQRAEGNTELVKIILSATVVLITVFASFISKEFSYDFCANLLQSLLYTLIPLTALVVLISGFYRLQYDIAQIHEDRLGIVVNVVKEADSLDGILQKIDKSRLDLPKIHKPSLYTCQYGFLVLIALICFYPLIPSN